MGAIRVIKEKCTGCGICVQICPFNSITIVEDIAVISESCTLCGACISDCPGNSIEIIDEKEKIMDEVKKWNPKCSFPTIVINDKKVIVGFKEDEIIEALNNE